MGEPEEVYHRPATPFVYHFLGRVNLFHGRVEGGKVFVGGLEMPLPGGARPGAKTANVYVRPHLFDIDRVPNGKSHFPARVTYINRAGPHVKVELETAWGEPVQVELPEARFLELGLERGAEVYVRLRDEKVFIEMPEDEAGEGAPPRDSG